MAGLIESFLRMLEHGTHSAIHHSGHHRGRSGRHRPPHNVQEPKHGEILGYKSNKDAHMPDHLRARKVHIGSECYTYKAFLK